MSDKTYAPPPLEDEPATAFITRGTTIGREPDVGHNSYRPTTRTGAMVFRKNFILSALEPPADRIRKLLTDIEFEGLMDDEDEGFIENMLQQIESIIGEMRLLVREPSSGE